MEICNHEFVEEDENEVCCLCGEIKETPRIVSGFNRNVRIRNRYKYSREDNFRRILDAYLALENFKLDKKTRNFFLRKLKGREITREAIHDEIRTQHKKKPQQKWNLLYKHVNLIYTELTGNKPKVDFNYKLITHQFSVLLQCFEKLKNLHFKHNFISYQLTLYELLKRNGAHPDERHFRFLKNQKTLNHHRNLLDLLMTTASF